MHLSLYTKSSSKRPQSDKFVRLLSKDEVHAATTAFNRSRGHFHGLNIDHFRDTLLQEAFVFFPAYLVEKLFREWNFSRSGELSCSEFVGGTAIAVKGMRDDHLEMVFRMLSESGDSSTASRADVARFFKCFAQNSGCAAIDQRRTAKVCRSWTSDELLHELFGWSQTGEITFKKFHAVLGSGSSFTVLQYTNWIPNFGKRLLNAENDILTLAMPCKLTNLKLFETHEGLSSEQRGDVRFELRSILYMLSTDPTRLVAGSVIDKFRDAVDNDLLLKTIANAWQSSSASEKLDQTKETRIADQVREELKHFVLGLCCAQASSVQLVYRLLFELFDEYSCGQIDAEQLGAFIQLVTGNSPVDSEREASVAIRKRGRSLSSSPSPPTSPGGSPAIHTESPRTITLPQFVEVAQQQPGFSFAEIETALQLFHLSRHSSTPIIPSQLDSSLHQLLNSYFLEESSKSNAFCLLELSDWQKIVGRAFKCQSGLSAHTSTQLLYEEVTELPSNHVIMPLSIWLLVSFWLDNEYKKQLMQQPVTISDWATSIHVCRSEQRCLYGFWLRVSLSFTSCDGFERYASFPQVIVFEHCTIQGIVDAVLFQKSWCGRLRSRVTTMSQCQVLIAERTAAGEIKTVIHQDEPATLTQDQLTTSLRSVLATIYPSWVLGSTVKHDKLSFELRFSVVEIEEPAEMDFPALRHNEASNDASPFVKSSQQTMANKIPRGLNNLGNTCFMNAVLQCLAATPLLNHHTIRQEILSSVGPREKPSQSERKSVPVLLAELLAELNRADTASSISPTNLFKAFGALSPHLADGNQQDAEEFLVCLLSHLGNALKQSPKLSEPNILSPRSHVVLTSLFRSKDEKQGNLLPESTSLQIEDSNGRHDRLVATEWWVSHLVNDPSLINILFSGQFKSALTCDHCAHQSARFEPFSSLQLPLNECSTTTKYQRDLVVIIHAAKSSNALSVECGPVRTVVQTEDHSTLADILQLLPPSPSRCYVFGDHVEHTIQNLLVTDSNEDQLEDKTPASALPSPAHVFEVMKIPGSGDDPAAPTTGSSQLYLRFVHRQNFLVPFYCTTPVRQRLCGSPFVCSSTRGALTGLTLYQMVFRRFLLGRSAQFRSRSSSTDISKQRSEHMNHHYAPNFVLRRVRGDGLACSRCHWSKNCHGCQILSTTSAAELLDLENCETIAIDWDVQQHPQDQTAFWWLQCYPTRDHQSYLNYRQTHSLMRNLHSLCSTEHLDAGCFNCQQQKPSTLTPHTKQLSFWSLPPILVLQLKRFELVTSNGNYQWNKLDHNVDFPVYGLDLLDLLAPVDGAHSDSEPCSDRCSKDTLDPRVRRGIDFLQQELNVPLTSASRSCTKYDLYAVVHHSGSGISSGHYMAHIRRPEESCWWLADDASVSPMNEDNLSPSSTAYLLFYVRQDVATGATELQDMFPLQHVAI